MQGSAWGGGCGREGHSRGGLVSWYFLLPRAGPGLTLTLGLSSPEPSASQPHSLCLHAQLRPTAPAPTHQPRSWVLPSGSHQLLRACRELSAATPPPLDPGQPPMHPRVPLPQPRAPRVETCVAQGSLSAPHFLPPPWPLKSLPRCLSGDLLKF